MSCRAVTGRGKVGAVGSTGPQSRGTLRVRAAAGHGSRAAAGHGGAGAGSGTAASGSPPVKVLEHRVRLIQLLAHHIRVIVLLCLGAQHRQGTGSMRRGACEAPGGGAVLQCHGRQASTNTAGQHRFGLSDAPPWAASSGRADSDLTPATRPCVLRVPMTCHCMRRVLQPTGGYAQHARRARRNDAVTCPATAPKLYNSGSTTLRA